MSAAVRSLAPCAAVVLALVAAGSAQAFPGETTAVSVNAAGLDHPGGTGELPKVSADGRYATFFTPGAMVPEDTNATYDVFLRDLAMRTTERISVSSNGLEGNDGSFGGSQRYTIRYRGRNFQYRSVFDVVWAGPQPNLH